MPLHESKKATLADWEALGEDVRAELIDGEIYYLAPPSRKHQAIVSFLHTEIKLISALRRQGILDCEPGQGSGNGLSTG